MTALVLLEHRRAHYFASLYPSDLLYRMIAGLGPRRCKTESERPVFASSSRKSLEEDAEASDASMDIEELEEHPARTILGYRIRHFHLTSHQFAAAFASAMHLRAHCISQPGLLSFHVHSAVVRSDVMLAQQRVYVFEEHEFVVDLDLHDHEKVFSPSRRLLCACPPKAICSVCWLLAELGATVVSAFFTRHLGSMLTVYSGGKGCHLWFGSPAARRLEENDRAHLLAKLKDHARAPARVTSALTQAWVKRGIVQRALLANPETSPLAQYMRETYAPKGFAWESGEAIAALLPAARSFRHWQRFTQAAGPGACLALCVHLAWPVPDAEVTAGTSMHMLKTPFSIHSTTGRVALPLEKLGANCVPEKMPRADDPNLAQHPLWSPALTALEQWLEQCDYPRKGRV